MQVVVLRLNTLVTYAWELTICLAKYCDAQIGEGQTRLCTVPAGERLVRPHIFFLFFVLGQPASVNDVQGIMLHI